jgi:flagellar assembly factor FliW
MASGPFVAEVNRRKIAVAQPLLNPNCMKTVELDEPQRLPVKKENVISMPLGLLGFEQVKKYVLLITPEEEPFLWLQMLDNQSQGFVVINPSTAFPDYAPDIAQADIEFLGVQSPADALLLNIVTVRNGQATANLKGPIVINRHTLVGKQCIPTNVAEFSLQHPVSPMPVAA